MSSSKTRRELLKSAGAAGLAAMAAGSNVAAQPAVPDEVLRVRTPVLDIGYESHGGAGGTPVILLHGFPYDIRSFDGAVAPLVAAGYRVLLPYLRGYGPTRFVDLSLQRMAEQAALAQDVLDFADALGIERFALAGFDWGNRAACIVSIIAPERVLGQVSIGGYTVQNTVERGGPMPARLAAGFWYMWYFNTAEGAAALAADRHGIIRYLWDTWSPAWQYADADYARSAPSFDNADFVPVVVHSYRHRLMNAPGEARFEALERSLAERPPIEVPAIVLRPDSSGLGGPPTTDPTADQARFTNLVDRRIIEGAGHDLPAHRPDALAGALIDLLG